MTTIYKENPNGAYALYSEDDGMNWRESAKLRNESIEKADLPSMVEGLEENRIDRLVSENKYNRKIIGLDGRVTVVDVYRVLDAYTVINPQLNHLIKKALCAGLRGHKDKRQDLIDIRDSIDSAIEMHDQKAS